MISTTYVDNPLAQHSEKGRFLIHNFLRHTNSYFSGILPIVTWLPKYNLTWFCGDIICGLTMGIVSIPQAIAFAAIAGLPAQYGLYSSFTGLIINPVFGTSKDTSIGPTAIISLFVGHLYNNLKATPEFQSGVWTEHQIMVTMALFAGIITTALGLLHLGILFNFISQPAFTGFVACTGVVVIVHEFSGIFGVPDIDKRDPAYMIFGKTLINLNHTHIDAVIGILSLIFLALSKRICDFLTRQYPQHARKILFANVSRNIIVVIVTTFLFWIINHFGSFAASPFAIVGPVPSGFEMIGAPQIDSNLVLKIIPSMPSMVTLLMVEHCSVAITLGKEFDYRVDVNQEFLTVGLSNIIGSFFSAYPSTASFSRSCVTAKSGARTPLTNVFVAVIIVLTIYVATPAVQYIPIASLSAIVAYAVLDLVVGPSTWHHLWKVHPSELLIFASGFLLGIFISLDIAVYVSVAISLVVQLYRSARPEFAFLGRMDMRLMPDDVKKQQWDDFLYCRFFSSTHPTLGPCIQPIAPGILAFQPRDNFLFENSIYLMEKLFDEVKRTTQCARPLPKSLGERTWSCTTSAADEKSSKPPLHGIILDLTGVHQMDYSAMNHLGATVDQVDRYSGKRVPWFFAINDSFAVRRCLLLAGLGTQRRQDGGGRFLSDLTQRQSDDEPGNNSANLKSKAPIATDLNENALNDEATSIPQDINSSQCSNGYSTITRIDDLYPYLFLSMQDAAFAACKHQQCHDVTYQSDISEVEIRTTDEEQRVGLQ